MTTEKRQDDQSKIRTPVKAIRAKCLDCCCNQRLEVKLCPAKGCPLWPYRLGHRPKNMELSADFQNEGEDIPPEDKDAENSEIEGGFDEI